MTDTRKTDHIVRFMWAADRVSKLVMIHFPGHIEIPEGYFKFVHDACENVKTLHRGAINEASKLSLASEIAKRIDDIFDLCREAREMMQWSELNIREYEDFHNRFNEAWYRLVAYLPDEELDRDDRQNKKTPDSPDVTDLCMRLLEQWQKSEDGPSQIDIAREFKNGDEPKAKSLLRQAQRFKHLWHPDHR